MQAVADQDDGQENQPHDQHAVHDPCAFLGRGGRKRQQQGEHGPTLLDPTAVRGKRLRHGIGAAGGDRGALQAGRSRPATRASVGQPSLAEGCSGRRPRLAVTRPALSLALRAEGYEVREVVDRVDVAARGDANEPVRVKVVAEQKRDVGRGGEQPRAAVVDEVAS